MREVISLHVGQAGVQIGNACCKLSYLDTVNVVFTRPRGTLYTRTWAECTCLEALFD